MHWLHIFGLIVVAAPALLVALLGISSLIGRPFSETWISRLVQSAMVIGLFASIGALAVMLATNQRRVPVELGHLVALEAPGGHVHMEEAGHAHHLLYHFSFKLEFDRLSVPFAILIFVLCGTIGAFADKYMHREAGFNRFFMLYAIFVLGMVIASLAGTIETLFTGWELVGLSSTLLVAFFQERANPCRNGLWVWVVYRLSDAGLLMAALVLHHLAGEGDFDKLMGTGAWPEGVATLTSEQALTVGLLILVAVAGKSALIPFSGWLPRAMEGPTPSSAVFYGALSVHLGAFMLLRVSPILALSGTLSAIVVILGLSTSILASFTGRVQTDIKSSLSYASMTQVGLIVAEIGALAWISPRIGCPKLLYIPLIHILGHGSVRTLQFVRAPTLLHDYRVLENAIGGRLAIGSSSWLGIRFSGTLYRMALHRGHLDSILMRFLVQPLLSVFQSLDRWELGVTKFLDRPSKVPPPTSLQDVAPNDCEAVR